MFVVRRIAVFCLLLTAAAFVAVPARAETAASLIQRRKQKVKLPPFQAPDVADFKPITLKDLPDLMTEVSSTVKKKGEVHPNGLLATINWDQFDDVAPDCKEMKYKLRSDATGFQKDLKLRVYMQDGKAPLAVTLLGFGMKADDKVAKAYQAYLHQSGCHVLSFDSIIRNEMNEATAHGVAGNFIAEAKICARIIDLAMDHREKDDQPRLRDLSTSVRLLGTSWGGLLSQQILRVPQAKTWPIDRCLILSTPVDLRTASRLLDQYAREDKPFYGIFQLAKLLDGYTPKKEEPNEDELSLMRAGLGYVFHGDLTELASSNIKRYSPELIEKLRAEEAEDGWRDQYAKRLAVLEKRHEDQWAKLKEQYPDEGGEAYKTAKDNLKRRQKVEKDVFKKKPSEIDKWNFRDFVALLSRPYWEVKEDLVMPSRMDELLKDAPNFVQAFVSADDPLCSPAVIESVTRRLTPPLLNIIPHGGHLGYSGTTWVRTLIGKYFKP